MSENLHPDQMGLPPETRAEFTLIEWIARQTGARPEVRLGIGDDASILSAPGRDWVVTTDVLTEGVHFSPGTDPALIGRKAMGVNLSDLAAMGAEPCAAFIGIVLPESFDRSHAERLYDGLFQLAREFNVIIAGGDTNSWAGPLVISVTLHGLMAPGTAIRRDGAQPGDWILVTGALGGSLQSQRHLTFSPRVNESRALCRSVGIHAMLDLSDGLGSDLFHLLSRSGVGAILDGEAIPIHSDVPGTLSPGERLQRALSDGEDFELLFCVTPEDGACLLEMPPVSVPLTRIGEVTAERSASLRWNGSLTPLLRSGWSHRFGS